MDNRTPSMPVLVRARMTKSNSKVNVYQETEDWCDMKTRQHLLEQKYPYNPVLVRNHIDKNNLVQLKGFEMNLKRKVAERYGGIGGSYMDLTAVTRPQVFHHKSVQTLRTAVSTSDFRGYCRTAASTSDLRGHSVVPSQTVIVREGQTLELS